MAETHARVRVPPALLYIGVALLAVTLYLPALANGFAYDDVAVIVQDARIHSLDRWWQFFAEPYWRESEMGLYRPLTTLSFAVDWAIGSGTARWFLITNIMWNGVACALACLLLARLTNPAAAFLPALVFAAHPVHVEAVANVVGRAEIGATIFVLAALLLWPPERQPPGRARIALMSLLFGVALLFKESAIMLPALVILLDVARGHVRADNIRVWLGERAPPLLMLALVAGLYLGVRFSVLGTLGPQRVDAVFEVTGGLDRALTALQAWPVYLRLLLFPTVLLADYGPRIILPAATQPLRALAGLATLILLLTAGFVAWRRGHGLVAAALAWLPVALLPISNLAVITGIIVAERAMYLPSFALALAGAAVMRRVLASRPQYWRGVAAAGAGAAVVVAFAGRTLDRIPDWKSTDTVFAALLRDRPDSFRAHWHHARIARVAGAHDQAIAHYAEAIRLWSFRRGLLLEAMHYAVSTGRLAYARDLAAFTAARWPADIEPAQVHAATLLDLGDSTAARASAAASLARHPRDPLLLRIHAAAVGDDP